MFAPKDTSVSPEVQARAQEFLAQGQRRKAIRLISEHTALRVSEAKDFIDSLVGKSIPAAPAVEPRSAQPGSDPGSSLPDLTAGFALALRHAKRMAGDPPYHMLASRASCSVPTISRVFAGRTLPRWQIAHAVLAAMNIPVSEIETEWRNLWIQALDQHRPLAQPDPMPYSESGSANSLEEHPATAQPAAPLEELGPLQQEQEPSPICVCDDCGALIGDLVQHQAWHWRIDRQLRRSSMRAIDGTA